MRFLTFLSSLLYLSIMFAIIGAFHWGAGHFEIWYSKIIVGLTLGPALVAVTGGNFMNDGWPRALLAAVSSLGVLVLVPWGIIQGIFF